MLLVSVYYKILKHCRIFNRITIFRSTKKQIKSRHTSNRLYALRKQNVHPAHVQNASVSIDTLRFRDLGQSSTVCAQRRRNTLPKQMHPLIRCTHSLYTEPAVHSKICILVIYNLKAIQIRYSTLIHHRT